MRQKTINLLNQGSFDKKIDVFPQTLSHIPRWVRLVQKTRAKNCHAWTPLKWFTHQEHGREVVVQYVVANLSPELELGNECAVVAL